MMEGHVRGDRVRALRIARGWTQYRLAYQAGIAVSFLSDIERGKRSPGSVVVAKLAEALGTSMDYLMGLTDDPRPLAQEGSNGMSPVVGAVPGAPRDVVAQWFRASGLQPEDADLLADMYERFRKDAQRRRKEGASSS